MDALLDSMSILLRRKKLLGYHKQNYLNIIRYTQKLVSINRLDMAAVHAFQQSVEAEEHLTEREWLLEMVG